MLTSLLQACCEHILLTITVSCEIFTVEDDLVHTNRRLLKFFVNVNNDELHLYSAFFIWICSSALLTVVDKYTNYKC
jgi:hypothetical protein